MRVNPVLRPLVLGGVAFAFGGCAAQCDLDAGGVVNAYACAGQGDDIVRVSEQQLETERARGDALRARLEARNVKVEQLRAERASLEEQYMGMQIDLDRLRARLDETRADNTALEAELDALASEVALRQQFQTGGPASPAAQAELDELIRKKQSLEAEVEALVVD